MTKVFMFKTPIIVNLTSDLAGVPNWNVPMNEPDFKIYHGASSTIEYVVRNFDRKPINLIGCTLILSIFDPETSKTLLQTPIPITDPYNGIATIYLDHQVFENWDTGFLNYSIKQIFPDRTETMLYTDRDKNALGYFELLDRVWPEPTPTSEIHHHDFTPDQSGWFAQVVFFSKSVPGNMQSGNGSGMHTIFVDFENFSGTFYLQGSLEQTASTAFYEWFYLPLTGGQTSMIFDGFTGQLNFEIVANMQWLRARFDPAINVPEYGKIRKILIRN